MRTHPCTHAARLALILSLSSAGALQAEPAFFPPPPPPAATLTARPPVIVNTPPIPAAVSASPNGLMKTPILEGGGYNASNGVLANPGGALRDTSYRPVRSGRDIGPQPEIEIALGGTRVLPAPGVARIAVGNGDIITAAALDNKEVILFANQVGTSTLLIWNEDGRYQRVHVSVVPEKPTRVAREIAAFLKKIPHAKASIIADKVIVEGDNLSDADLAKIDQLAKRYPQIINFTNQIGWEKMVLIDVKVVEFPTTELSEIGLKWNTVGGMAAGAIWAPVHRGHSTGQLMVPNPGIIEHAAPGSSLNLLSAVNLGLNATLHLLEQEGKAAVLAQPQLSARNGATASFLAGGEYPYTVSNVNGTTVAFKPYGISLNITPRVDRNGTIRASIMSEVSTIDNSLSSVSGPALISRRTETEFNVLNGETIVLSGLLSSKSGTDVDKVPLLGDLPVLGALFRSKRFQNDETELVVFVTPTIVDSRTPALVDRVAQTEQRVAQTLGDKPRLTQSLPPPPAVFGPPAPTGENAIGAEDAADAADLADSAEDAADSKAPQRHTKNGKARAVPPGARSRRPPQSAAKALPEGQVPVAQTLNLPLNSRSAAAASSTPASTSLPEAGGIASAAVTADHSPITPGVASVTQTEHPAAERSPSSEPAAEELAAESPPSEKAPEDDDIFRFISTAN